MSELPIHWHNDQALRTILPSYTTLAGCGEYHAPHDTVARLIFNTPSAGQELEWEYIWVHAPELDLRPSLLKLEKVRPPLPRDVWVLTVVAPLYVLGAGAAHRCGGPTLYPRQPR